MYDLIVIGGGPAALSATFYAIGKQLDVMMIYEELGGKIGWLQSLIGPDQQPYLPGNELAHVLTVQIMAQPDRTTNDRVQSVTHNGGAFEVATEQHGVLRSRTLLIATGARPLQLDVPGAEYLAEHGLDYSITTHAQRVKNKRVAVIGGTNRALSGAAELADTAVHVYIVAPDRLSIASPLGQALVQHPHIEVLEGFEVIRLGEDEGRPTVTVAHNYHQRELHVDHVFVALGLIPNSEIVRDLVETDSNGFIMVNQFHETSLPGLFAAGDVSTTFSEQVLIAIGDGARAALTAYDYLLAQRLVPPA